MARRLKQFLWPQKDYSDMLTFQEKYAAILRKDSAFEGVFVTAVKSTGIFCRPVCTARKPKPENVIFYSTPQEAILHGFRPCRVCKPMQCANETPSIVQHVLALLQEDPQLKLKDHDLREKGIEPSHLRRWFKKHHNLSFHAYQRMLRVNTAFQKITAGETVTHAAYDSGYNSLSGFSDQYRSLFGEYPTRGKEKVVITISRFTTPLGPMFACATSKGACLLEFTDRKMLETEFRDLCRRLNAVILPGKSVHLDQLQIELKEYFEGTRKAFTVILDTPGTLFQQQTWSILNQIPYGETRSYKQQALALNTPNAIRAVASANGHNRISIIIPCHRVIGHDGHLTGYGGGLARKKWLLDFEKSNLNKSTS